jgi:hypothetical protein
MSTGRKKVVVRRFSRDWVSGFLDPANMLTGSSSDLRLEMLDPDGRLTSLPLAEVKMVSFVRDFAPSDASAGLQSGPEKLSRRTFNVRPRMEGLWLRMIFRDNDILEGVAQNDASLLELQGIQFTPPDMRSNTQRIYVPRIALSELRILAVISTPGAAGRRKTIAAEEDPSLDLFSDLPSNPRPN